MIDLNLLRHDPDGLKRSLERRGEDPAVVDEARQTDEQRRALALEGDTLREQRNAASKAIGALMRGSAPSETDRARLEEMREEVRRVGERIGAVEQEHATANARLRELLLTIANPPQDDVPDGGDESDNVIVREVGERSAFDFEPKEHWALAESLGLVDMERGAKLSGSRFYVLGEQGARLQRALVSYMLDLHRRDHGYREMGVPLLVRPEVMEGSGQLPKFADNLYHDDEDDLWLIPTAEVPLANLHRDEILPPGALPIRYMAHTHCFRREKAAAGRDTRGIKRVHQFEKVELFHFTTPEDSGAALDALLSHAEAVCSGLELPYRVQEHCTGDLPFQVCKSYDIDVWAPASQEWLEVSSCSNCGDFQARRANIRFRREQGARPEFVHTLNGSGLALPRIVIALIESGQRTDGSVRLPDALVPYMGQAALTPAV
ncbi:MAG: serine--tRNA ligase [Chloroflexota bacterium]|nr:serine--tRNA ligase [Chloroflexota bacterium]